MQVSVGAGALVVTTILIVIAVSIDNYAVVTYYDNSNDCSITLGSQGFDRKTGLLTGANGVLGTEAFNPFIPISYGDFIM